MFGANNLKAFEFEIVSSFIFMNLPVVMSAAVAICEIIMVTIIPELKNVWKVDVAMSLSVSA